LPRKSQLTKSKNESDNERWGYSGEPNLKIKERSAIETNKKKKLITEQVPDRRKVQSKSTARKTDMSFQDSAHKCNPNGSEMDQTAKLKMVNKS